MKLNARKSSIIRMCGNGFAVFMRWMGWPKAVRLSIVGRGYFGRSWNNVVPVGPFKPMAYPDAYNHPELART